MANNEKMSLLVRNLRYETSPDRVRKFFERYGEVRDVYLPLHYHTKKPRGFGFVEFFDEADAHECLRCLHRSTLDGNEISVTIAQQGRKSPDTMRHRETLYQERRPSSRSRSGSPGRGRRGGGGGGRSWGGGGGDWGRRGRSRSRSRSGSQRRRGWRGGEGGGRRIDSRGDDRGGRGGGDRYDNRRRSHSPRRHDDRPSRRDDRRSSDHNNGGPGNRGASPPGASRKDEGRDRSPHAARRPSMDERMSNGPDMNNSRSGERDERWRPSAEGAARSAEGSVSPRRADDEAVVARGGSGGGERSGSVSPPPRGGGGNADSGGNAPPARGSRSRSRSVSRSGSEGRGGGGEAPREEWRDGEERRASRSPSEKSWHSR